MANAVLLAILAGYLGFGTAALSAFSESKIVWTAFALHNVALFASVLLIWSPRRRAWITGHLRHRQYNQLYLLLLKPLLGRALGWFGQELAAGDQRGLGRTFLDGLTYRLIDKALLIALAYPLLLLFAYWAATGADGKLGEAVFFPAEESPWKRAVAVCLIGMVLLSPLASARAAASPKRFVRSVSGLLPVFAVAGAFAFAQFAERRSGKAIGGPILLGLLGVLVAIGFAAVDWEEVPSRVRSLMIFAAVFPLLNAAFDALSYAVTLGLTQRGLRAGPWALLLGVLDFAVAALLFLGLGVALIAAIALINSVTGVMFVDLGSELARIGNWREYWWAYAMVFSTLIPTVLHGLIAAFSLQACAPFSWRLRLATAVERSDTESDEALIAVLGISTIWFFSIAAPLAMISGVIWLASGSFFTLGAAYRDFLVEAAHWAGAF